MMPSALAAALLAVSPPALFFTDLQSGPNAGGEANHGTVVTLYGARFGAQRSSSTVTVGGAEVAAYLAWSDARVSVAIGSAAQTGDVLVHVGGVASNAVPFTVRTGNLWYVSPSGSDSAPGSFTQPWQTLKHAYGSMAAGDVTYLLDGTAATTQDGYSADVWLGQSGSGTAAAPMALVGYPGARVLIGDPSDEGVRGSNYYAPNDYWVIAGLTLTGYTGIELGGGNHWRIVGNDISCPGGSGLTACVHVSNCDGTVFYGNYVHDIGTTYGQVDKYFHAVYFTTDSNHVDVGWNTIVPNPNHLTTSGGCRALQFYSTGGTDQYDLHVHDNFIHDAICDGINFATVNPDLGTVEAYNNVVYHVGTGPDPGDGQSHYACINIAAFASPTGAAQIYNNTLVDCGPRANSDSGGVAAAIKANLMNNLTSLTSAESYVTASAGDGQLSGSNNLWFGGSLAAPSTVSASILADPLFMSATAADFHLQPASPARSSGVTMPQLGTDIAGVPRPQGPAYSVGAYEYDVGYVPPPRDAGVALDAGSPGDGGGVSPDAGTAADGGTATHPAHGCGCGADFGSAAGCLCLLAFALLRRPRSG